MTTIFFSANNAYEQNDNLRKEDVRALIQWVQDQPHLPNINEAQAILFLHRWHYQLEESKAAVDTYFTVRTYCSGIFSKRNSMNSYFKDSHDIWFCSILPQKSRKGYSVVFCKFLIPDVNRFSPQYIIRYFDVLVSLDLYEKGPSKGYIIVLDVENFGLEMVAKCHVSITRKFFYYMQKVSVGRLKEYHLISHVPWMDKVVTLIKPFVEEEFRVYVHQTLNDLYEHIPQSALPKDYGGSEESVADLHVKMGEKICDNAGLLDWEEGQIVDENKRRNKSSDVVEFLERGSIRNGKFEID